MNDIFKLQIKQFIKQNNWTAENVNIQVNGIMEEMDELKYELENNKTLERITEESADVIITIAILFEMFNCSNILENELVHKMNINLQKKNRRADGKVIF